MREHLVFTLSANLAAMGDLAGHERRGSWTWPGRSAITGLIAAALGIRRDGDFSSLDALQISVAVFSDGQPLRDYHTVQTVPTALVRHPQSRPEALRKGGRDLNTTITLRDYRADTLFGVAIAGDRLHEIAAALERPVFTLYFGRKSCPLNAPLAPAIVRAESPAVALTSVKLPPWWPENKHVARTLYCDAAAAEGGRVETRHDAAIDRRLWHFEQRAVRIVPVEIRGVPALP